MSAQKIESVPLSKSIPKLFESNRCVPFTLDPKESGILLAAFTALKIMRHARRLALCRTH
jgi:hypothetical protein